MFIIDDRAVHDIDRHPGIAACPRRRPTTVADVRKRSAAFVTHEGVRYALAFQPRATDVFIATYPKSGTTWMQQIVHGLRTEGSMAFAEITEVVPWVELAFDMCVDLRSPQGALPRAFKSHLNWNLIPKGGRYIYVVRDPKDVLVSYYRFYEGWRFEPGSISISTFARDLFMKPGAVSWYWSHLASWWEHRYAPNVLVLSYEEMKDDLRDTVRTVAQFIGCPWDDALLDTIVHQSSIEFMLAHREKFDDHLVRQARDAACDLPPGGTSAKVRNGRVGDSRLELPRDISEELDAIWRRTIGSDFGHRSFDSLRAEIASKSRSSLFHA